MLELSSVLGAADRVTRKVLLGTKGQVKTQQSHKFLSVPKSDGITAVSIDTAGLSFIAMDHGFRQTREMGSTHISQTPVG